MEFTFGLMVRDTLESGSKTKCLEKAHLTGQMVVTSKVNSKTELCTDKEFTLGEMAEDTKAAAV